MSNFKTYVLDFALKQVNDLLPQSAPIVEMKEDMIVVPPKDDGLSSSENKRIPIPEHVEPEPKKCSFLSRFFLPYG
jgi:hypothetical protein